MGETLKSCHCNSYILTRIVDYDGVDFECGRFFGFVSLRWPYEIQYGPNIFVIWNFYDAP